ncbi:MAG: imidazoleglycerol-phosphate dehydratase HisB [Candidatus Izemoplasmataceae bacterium]
MKTNTTLTRKTKETNVSITIDLNNNDSSIQTSIPFLDHMLTAFAYYANLSLTIRASGDTEIDQHHLVEDIGITLGRAFQELIYQDIGRKRFASITIPMDEALSQVTLDFSNRPYLIFNDQPKNEFIGTYQVNNTKEFFYAFSIESRITLHINVIYGENDHHMIESYFKALGLAFKEALTITTENVTSTKGAL